MFYPGAAAYYRLGQGISARFAFNFGKRNDLSLFCEFLERFKASLAANNNPSRVHGLFAFAAYRIELFEPFATYEHFKALLERSTRDDTMIVSGGINFYPLDNLEMQLYYRWDYIYLDGSGDHTAGLALRYMM